MSDADPTAPAPEQITTTIALASLPPQWVADGVVLQVTPNPGDDDLFIVKRRPLSDYYHKKQQLSDVEGALARLREESRVEKERLDGIIKGLSDDIAQLHNSINELKETEAERDAMMRIAGLVKLIDRHVSRTLFQNSNAIPPHGVLEQKRFRQFDASLNDAFTEAVTSFKLSSKQALHNVIQLRNGIGAFRADRNYECHDALKTDMSKEQFYQVIDAFCESYSVKSEAEVAPRSPSSYCPSSAIDWSMVAASGAPCWLWLPGCAY